MRIAVIGAGGMGGFFGAVLARAGEDVTLVARGERLSAIESHGLRVTSATLGDFTARVAATDDPADIGPVDLVLMCVKTYDLTAATPLVPPLIRANTLVLPIQNGVEAADQLAAELGQAAVLGGVSWVTAHSTTAGEVRHVRGLGLLLGELEGGPSARVTALSAALARAGLEAGISQDIRAALWQKLMGVCVVAGLAGVTRLPLGPMLASTELRDVALAMLEEIAAVAVAHGVHIARDAGRSSLATLETMARGAPSAHPSLYEDLIHGRPIELDALNGAVVRLGRAAQVPTPVNGLIAALLSPYRAGTPRVPALAVA